MAGFFLTVAGKECGREQSWPIYTYCPSIWLKGMKNLRYESRSLGRNWSQNPPEYEA
jgi:hypothetical protein